MTEPLPLVFSAPRRGMPPQHFADLDDAGRIDAVTDVGLPAYRAKQLAHQYYARRGTEKTSGRASDMAL